MSACFVTNLRRTLRTRITRRSRGAAWMFVVGLLAAWFGGKAEGANDVKIWQSAYDGKTWSQPVAVAEKIAVIGRTNTGIVAPGSVIMRSGRTDVTRPMRA